MLGIIIWQKRCNKITPWIRWRQIQIFRSLVAHQVQIIILWPRNILKTIWKFRPVWINHWQRLVLHVHHNFSRRTTWKQIIKTLSILLSKLTKNRCPSLICRKFQRGEGYLRGNLYVHDNNIDIAPILLQVRGPCFGDDFQIFVVLTVNCRVQKN